MKKLLVTIFSILLLSSITFAAESIKAQLNRIEQNIWGFEYSTESDNDRLKRIEESVLGSINTKLSAYERINLLNQTLGIETNEAAQMITQEVQNIESESVSYPMVDKLEMKVLSKTYDKENVYSRLERLEKKVYGSKQDGDLDGRLTRLAAGVNMDTTGPRDADLYLQIGLLENTLFKQTYDQDPLELRLNRLERKIFQRDFSTDGEDIRLQRLQAAATAKKTAKYYDANKAAKYTSTGVQIGTIILMILAILL